MKILKRMLISLVCTLVFFGVVVLGGYIFVRSKYGIDIFKTVGQLKTLSQTIDESALCPNAFRLDDFEGLKTGFCGDLKCDIVEFEEGSGYKGYSVNFSALSSVDPAELGSIGDVRISEKQAGALAAIIFFTQAGGKITAGDKDLETTIVQIDFSNIDEDGSADFCIVVKVNLSPLTEEMSGFPMSMIKKYIPENLYILSTVRIEKTEAQMGYSVLHKELRVNNLSASDTEDLFHTLDTVLKIGTAKDLNTNIGTIAADVLIGNEENNGFAYSLKQIGKTDFNFKTLDGVDHFVIS